MKMKRAHHMVFPALVIVSGVWAQQLLTADEAVRIALKNNFDIASARSAADIAKVNNSAGNAGMLPSVSALGSDNYSFNKIAVKTQSDSVKRYTSGSNSLSAGIALNWTLFDGTKMFITRRKLDEMEALGRLQLKDRVQGTVYGVIAAYFDVVRQKQRLVSLMEVISYNQDRVTMVKTSFNAGLLPKTTYLQAQIDLNVYRESAVNQQSVITTSKRALNLLLGRDPEIDFEVSDSIPLDFMPDTAAIFEKLYKQNTAILSLISRVEVARLSADEFSALRFPRISLNAGYNFLEIDNTRGATLMNRSFGPLIGGTVSIPLYQAGAISRQVATARLQLQATRYELESTKLQVRAQVRNALDEFENQRILLQIERDNAVLAKENLDISMDRLRLGEATSLELRQAEESYESARTRLLDIEYNLKLAETKLRQLIAEL